MRRVTTWSTRMLPAGASQPIPGESMTIHPPSPENQPSLPLRVSAVVGFLVFVELASGFVQGYYNPLFSEIARHSGVSDADITWFVVVQTLSAAVSVPILSRLG